MKNLIDTLNSHCIEWGKKNGYKSHQVTANGMGQPIKVAFRNPDGTRDEYPIRFQGKKALGEENGFVGKYYPEVKVEVQKDLENQWFQITAKGSPAREYVVVRYYLGYDGAKIPA